MTESKITPDKITKPIQLLGAWLAGLILVNGSFLTTASVLSDPQWLRSTLVIASVCNVPLFLFCLFLLQTKFRPEMQEDTFYSKYLEQNTGKMVVSSPVETGMQQLRLELAESNQRYVEMISGLDAGLKALALEISMAKTNGDQVQSDKLAEVVKVLARSAQTIERSKERATDATVKIAGNDLLPEFTQLRKELRRKGLSIDRTFGSSSHEPEVPKFRIIGFGTSVPVEILRRVVSICRNYGFDRIHFTPRDQNAGHIYIGSYIYKAPDEPQPVPLDDEVLELLNADDTELEDVIAAIENKRL
ncbi:MAG: hypothetical protein HZT41_15825 [Dechloromonas sp.]|nr:MAG: hypothetical protein HZT41_15825 [Dechloromonas sp.]